MLIFTRETSAGSYPSRDCRSPLPLRLSSFLLRSCYIYLNGYRIRLHLKFLFAEPPQFGIQLRERFSTRRNDIPVHKSLISTDNSKYITNKSSRDEFIIVSHMKRNLSSSSQSRYYRVIRFNKPGAQDESLRRID